MSNSLISYDLLKQDVAGEIFKVQQNIGRMISWQKVQMSWKIGSAINEYLQQNEASSYGQKIFEKLASDVGLSSRILYQMSAFHKTYPDMPKDDGVLNWSHYRELIKIADDDLRQDYQSQIIENNLGANLLQKQIKQDKILNNKSSKTVKNKILKFNHGQLFTYNLVEKNHEKFIDLGFNIQTEINTNLKASDGVIESSKDGNEFKLSKSSLKKKSYCYKAIIDKVVDGDTLRVWFDLGFKIRHKQIIRLAKINAPELKTNDGKQAREFLVNLLKKVNFIVIKTNKIDIYGRYVGDIFYLEDEADATKVAQKGHYLNQILLDNNLYQSL